MPFALWELVPDGDDVTWLPPQVHDGSTMVRKLGVKFAVDILWPEAGTTTLTESELGVPLPVHLLNW